MINELLINAHPIVQAVAGGASYGGSHYLRVRWAGNDITRFDPVNFGTTLAFSAFIGAGLWVLGIVPTFESTGAMLFMFGGVVGISEACVKALVRGEHQLARKLSYDAATELIFVLMGLGRSTDEVKESVEEETQRQEGMTDEERQEEWDGLFPEEETELQVDDSDEEGDVVVPVEDRNGETSQDELPPA